ncbi:mspIM [Symbiodinium sp. CCMP2592]|nr:mspIM [Symbiodinium sp. CCMP2592]CAE7460845.1 mspIM [Symbiodinium sp. CCMP2592]
MAFETTESATSSSQSRQLSRVSSNSRAEPVLMAEASSRVVEAKWFIDCTLLKECAAENLHGFAKLYPEQFGDGPVAKMPKTQLSWGSACSGCEGALYVAHAINASFAGAKWPVRLQHRFSCESCRDKQKWVHVVSASHRCADADELFADLFGADDEDDDESHHTCIFADIQNLGNETAHCVVHNRECPVPQVDVFMCGVSCKDVSRQNPGRDMSKHVIAEGHSRGGTAQTWQGFASYVSIKQPGIVVFENVDGLDDNVGQTAQSNMDVVVQTMKGFGYEAQPMMTDAHEFGCPSKRRRVYICFFKRTFHKFCFQDRPLSQSVTMFRSMTASCMRSAPCVTEVLLDGSCEAVSAGLLELQNKRAQAEERAANAKAKAKAKAQPAANWVEQHLKASETLGVRWGQPAGRELESSPWFRTLTDREKDALVLSRSHAPQAGFRNLSQSLNRIHTMTLAEGCTKHVAPTMLPGQILFVELVRPPRLLLGREALILQGFPVETFLRDMDVAGYNACDDPFPNLAGDSAKKRKKRMNDKPWLTEALMMDLAGNSFSFPVLLAVWQSAVCAVDYRAATETVKVADVEEAMDALAFLVSL